MNRDRWLLDQEGAIIRLLQDDYGLSGLSGSPTGIRLLSGEYDCNLAVVAAEGNFLLKVMRSTCATAFVEMQCGILEHLAQQAPDLPAQRLVRTKTGRTHTVLREDGGERITWLTTFLPGRLLAEAKPQTADLHEQVGKLLGQLDRALGGFDHPELGRPCPWDLRQAGWSPEDLEVIADPACRERVATLNARFTAEWSTQLEQLRRGPIHGDGNDHNLLITRRDGLEELSGVVDFGDTCRTALACEPAIAGAYAMLCTDDPIDGLCSVVSAYHRELPLEEQELALMLPLALMRLCQSVVNSARASSRRPGDDYMTVHEQQAQRVLGALQGCDFDVAEARLRQACQMPAWPRGERLSTWLEQQRGSFAEVLGEDLRAADGVTLDLSFESLLSGDDCEQFDPALCQDRIAATLAESDARLGIGRYGEPRPFYLGSLFGENTPNGRRRTQHLGIDLFAPAGTAVRSPLAGQVASVSINCGRLDYGGAVVLRHQGPDESFGVLYAHLDPNSIRELREGTEVPAGTAFAALGAPPDNGDWPPHLHIQLLASDLPPADDTPPGVADPDHFEALSPHYPDPSPLLNLPPQATWRATDRQTLLDRRQTRVSAALRFGHGGPLHIVRGRRHCLYDQHGRRYLDAYNNVPHVGHAHPRVVAAIHRQSGLLATNTRYLGEALSTYAERLTANLPDALSVCLFVNSGSEANELALRLARASTAGRELLVMDHGYHGNTTGAVGVSPYKFRHQPGPEPAPWVHVTPQPDVYRGPFRGDDAGARYAAQVGEEITKIQSNGGAILGYLSECLPSVGGQIVPPPGFFTAVYQAVREAGGVCIADDVQTALGRTGKAFFGFELFGATPDILVLGKPLGNGYPIGAVVTTEAIASAFARGPEFFSTFGGNTVACAAGLAVLEVLEEEGLQQHALQIGNQLLSGLADLQREHATIGDVRGSGLFLGVELVTDRDTREPAPAIANYVKNRLRERRVLIGTEGPADNVLKIRPPMTFDAVAAEVLLTELAAVLREDRAQADAEPRK
ncbi:MAG: aminotransferase class III-fold pyridoxal phosphate-dependent enzyme [Planctomycetota bacterium]|nr:aminotransferase class III-fold pyridoxal phosphate-dependent enzyme [Planctomycetota bacterium]